jgi:hypothetical protein
MDSFTFSSYHYFRTDQLHRVMENGDFGCSDSVVIHVGTNDVRRSRNLNNALGEVYDLMTTVKAKFPDSKLVLSGVLRSKGMSWRQIGAIHDRLEWVAGNLEATFVDPDSWIGNGDFSRDGLHLNRDEAKQLGDLYCRVCGTGGEGQRVLEI